MINIEVYDGGRLIEKCVATRFPFRVGRQSRNDLIVPLAHCPGVICEIDRKENGYAVREGDTANVLAGRLIVTSGRLRVVIEDITHFDSETTQEVQVAKSNSGTYADSWISLGLFSILTAQVILIEYYNPLRKSSVDLFQPLVVYSLIAISVSASLSILSRAINHQYEFFRILRSSLTSLCLTPLIVQDLYGARWFLPSFFHFKEGYFTIWYLWGLLSLLLLTKVVFEHIGNYVRFSFVSGSLALVALLQFNDYVPIRDSFKYPTPETKALQIINSVGTPVEFDDFIKLIDESMSESADK